MKRSICDDESLKLANYGLCKRLRVSEARHQFNFEVSKALDRELYMHGLKVSARKVHQCVDGGARCCPDSLTKLAAKVAAAHTPFQLVEVRYPRIPEPVVRQFIKWSFPRCEADIRRYSALSCAACEHKHGPLFGQADSHRPSGSKDSPDDGSDDQEKAFNLGVMLAETGAVHQAMQIGFHISGVVHESHSAASSYQSSPNCHAPSTRRLHKVAATFDRCKVTSSSCDCEHGDGVFFCRHVVALLIYRMRQAEKVRLRLPISDTLQQLSRDQLQKLAQYLLARHASVLPTAQEIADDFDDPDSNINHVHGAPDPTAGAGFQDDDRWSLDDCHVSDYIRKLMLHPSRQTCPNEINSMLGKVREMMKVRDCNGARLLTLITKELLRQGATQLNAPGQSHCDVFGQLWDQISLLWICVVLNPRCQTREKEEVIEQLRSWDSNQHCPREDEFLESNEAHTSRRTARSVLSRAIDAGSLRWDDPHLRLILLGEESSKSHRLEFGRGDSPRKTTSRQQGGFANFSTDGKPLWHENTPMACARVEALRSHGYATEAIRLARAVGRTIRENAVGNFKLYKESQVHSESAPVKRNNGHGLVGDPLNPIHILYDALTSSDAVAYNATTKREGSLKRDAFEVCLLAIGEQRMMPSGTRSQEKVLQCEKALLDQLKKLKLDQELICVLQEVSTLLVEGGPASGLGKRVHRESVPMHSFATYIFKALLPHDRDLAFRVGLQAMRMPILDETSHSASSGDNTPAQGSQQRVAPAGVDEGPEVRPQPAAIVENPHPYMFGDLSLMYRTSWSAMRDLEHRQYELASELLQTAKGEVMTLRVVVESVQRHIRNGSHVFQLSHDAFKCATLQSGAAAADSTLLNVAMELAMQVLKMTLRGMNGRRRTEMVGWLVTCATEIGLCALLSIIKTWYTLFTPIEACTMVAGCIVSPNTAMRLSLGPSQRDEVVQCVCQMAVQCAVKDPQSCSLCALTLCESISSAFDAVYNVIIDAANKRRVESTQLYTIARYLDQRGYHPRAFAVAHAATKRLGVPFNHDAHPAANDLLWTTQLAQSIGMKELEELIKVIVDKVNCATVLSDILRACTSSISGRLPNCSGNYGNRGLRADRAPLLPLLKRSVAAYIRTIHSKLSHISPRHYAEFIEFLNKARETFFLAPDGHAQFSRLLADLKANYKGKKKLLILVSKRFRELV
uniref:Zinc finger SWIM domain-containing protein 4-like n=1 Tax=Phallusia mammillata TaxID=59560 RepID=A0A6F9DX86_9ASCI|nr:zinc finger SWIM domain-containing protein 4-like [Phallusia mammillata]